MNNKTNTEVEDELREEKKWNKCFMENYDSLVQAITEVNSQMEENSAVAKNLKEESENFVSV